MSISLKSLKDLKRLKQNISKNIGETLIKWK
jgi:hypothetical protein